MLLYIHHSGFLIICITQPGFIMRIAILADLHYSSSELKTCNIRETGSADIILRRAVFRLNRLIKPDLTILAGDLVNRGGKCWKKLAGLPGRAKPPVKILHTCNYGKPNTGI